MAGPKGEANGQFKHGMARTPTHFCWVDMKRRCNNPNNKKYHRYGGRGIKVCERWDDFRNFLADMGEKPEGMTLDRKDNNGDYCPENCRWATVVEQNRNRSSSKRYTLYGITKCMKEWCTISGVSYGATKQRINKLGWTPRHAIFTPTGRKPVDYGIESS